MSAPRLAAAALALSFATTPAAAAVTYDFTASFAAGPIATLTGFFTKDGETLTGFGLTLGDTVFGLGDVDTQTFGFFLFRSDSIVGIRDGSFALTTGVDDFSLQKTTILSITGPDEVSWSFDYSLDGLPDLISTNSVTVVERAAAVPEPASWATMIAGFALLGTTLRRRRLAIA